jgi:Domain of unknown function (DUF6436)
MQQGRISQRSAYTWAVVSVWLTGTAYAFWSFEFKQQRSFESARTVLFDSGARARSAELWFRETVAPQLAGADARVATVVHVYSADCSCNRFTHPHLARIISGYQHRGVSFVAAVHGPATALASGPASYAGPTGIQQVELRGGSDLAWIESTPAALVFDAAGRLVYFGPYSDSARCGESAGLVERVLDRMLGGQAPRPQPFYGGGCFCSGANLNL